jgi:phage terminase large subunit
VSVDETLEAKKRPISTAQEFLGYAWVKAQDGKPNKELPNKIDDHGMDAMRYLVTYADQGVVLKPIRLPSRRW